MIPVVNQLLDAFEGLENSVMPAESRWGFATTPTLQQLQQQHSRQHDLPPVGHSDVQTSYILELERDNTFISNHCVVQMAQQLGISQYTDNLSGTLLSPQLPNAAATDAARQSIRDQVDSAWSKEAVWRGVAYAKSGDYDQAMECYDKALLLNPNNCDAYVARGAAHANQKQFSAALHDFRTALKLDPENANAAKYMHATDQHARVAAAAAAQQEGRHAEEQPAAAGQAGTAADNRRHAAAEQAGIMQQDLRQLANQRGDRHDPPEHGRQQQHSQPSSTHQQRLYRAPHTDDAEQQYSHERGRQRQQQGMEQQGMEQQGKEQQGKEQQDGQHHSYKYASRSSRSPVSRKRKRSKSSDGQGSSSSGGGGSSSSASSGTSDSSSDHAGAAGQGLKCPSIADIQAAIQVLRSEQQHKKRARKDHHKRGSKKAKRKRKHSGHKHHNSKRKHKSRR